jgi:hypothetical protein
MVTFGVYFYWILQDTCKGHTHSYALH